MILDVLGELSSNIILISNPFYSLAPTAMTKTRVHEQKVYSAMREIKRISRGTREQQSTRLSAGGEEESGSDTRPRCDSKASLTTSPVALWTAGVARTLNHS